MTRNTNWAGNITFSAKELHRPASVEQLQELVATSDRVRALGSGHSFNTVADTTGEQVSIVDLPKVIELDSDAATVTVSAGLRYGEITGLLDEHGFALPNLGSLPHISIAGACATSTHGSGNTNQVLANQVSAMKLVTADGAVRSVARGDADFAGAVLSLGSLGIVIELTLDLVPSFEISQYVYDDLGWDQLAGHLDEITGAAYSVSLFTDYRSEAITGAWLKSKETRQDGDFFGARRADGGRHPVPGVDARFTTQQDGVPGPWQARLPHFRLEFTPSNGEEIQSEYFVDRVHAVAAIEALRELGDVMAPVLMVAEIRTIAADELWLSPASGRDRVALHFTWERDIERLEPVLREVEQRLAPFDAVPHWGKVFFTEPELVASLHPRLADFAALARSYDPAGKLANDFTQRFLPGR